MKTIILIIALLIPVSAHSAQWDFPSSVKGPSKYQMRLDYDGRTDGQPVYVCYSKAGTATSSTDWICNKFTYDGSDQVTVKQTAENVSYDNRASATYQ